MTSDLLATERVTTEYGQVRVARLGPTGRDAAVPPLVFVHGYPDNLQIWGPVARRLAHHYDVIAFDWPGLGHSDDYVGGATPFHLGRHFHAVLDALGVDKAVPVGFDMGAHAVIAAVHSQPERFPKLVLTNYLADGEAQTSWDIAVMRRLGLNQLFLARLPRIVFRRAQQSFLQLTTLSNPVKDDLWAGFARTETRDHLVRMCAGYQAALPRVTRLYPDINIPTLVLWADSDPHFPIAQARAVADALPNGTLTVLEGESHWFMWESPDRVAEALARFANG